MSVSRGFVLGFAVSAALLLPANGQSETPERTYGVEWGTGDVICTDDADAQHLPDDPSYARAAAWDRLVLGENECGLSLAPLDGGTWGESAPFSGRDSEGRKAEFRLYVLHDRYNWQAGSAREVEDDGEPVELEPILTTPEFFQRFCAGKAVFSLGAASHEGPTAVNHELAARRGERVSGKLAGVRAECPAGPVPILYGINLGEARAPGDCDTQMACRAEQAAQRRVIIVAAIELAIDVNLREALQQGLEEQEVFRDLSLDDYDLFVVTSL